MPKRYSGPPRYATYSRCSSDDQAHKDFSTTDVQTNLNQQYVQGKGGTIYEAYKDEGITGTTIKRPEFQRLLADARSGKFDVVVVTYMSRLGRGDTYTVAEYLLKEASVKVEMVKEQFTDDMAGFVNKQMTQFVDGMYVQQVRQWTRTKMEAMVKAGYVCGGTVPFGLKKELVSDASMVSRNDKEPPKRFVPHPDEVALVREAFELFAEVGSYPKVVAYLRSVTSRPWSIDTTSYMLRNVVYRGILKFGEWVNEKAHEALISEELWLAVREMDAKRPARSAKQDPVDSSSFYLRGLVFCSHCGNKMSPANHHGRTARVRYYECIGCVQKGIRQCPVRRINADSLHEAVVREIQRAAEHPTRMTEIIREAVKLVPTSEKLDDQVKTITRRLREAEKKINNITSAVARGGGSVRPLLKMLKDLEGHRISLDTERKKLERQIADTRIQRPDTGHVRALWGKFGELWGVATEAERSELMPLLVDRVEMHEKERGFCRLWFSLQNPRPRELATLSNVVIRSQMGAGVGLEPTTSGL